MVWPVCHCTVWAGPQHQGTGGWVRGETHLTARSRANSKLQVFHQLLHSLFTQPYTSFSWRPQHYRVCSRHTSVLRDDWKTPYETDLFCFFFILYMTEDSDIYISCLTHKKKEENMLWMKSSFNASNLGWISTLARQRTRQGLCRNVLSLLKHLSKPAHLSPPALVSLYAVDFMNESADRWCHALVCVRTLTVCVCVCVWLLTRAIYICILLLLLATGSGSKHLLTSLSYLAVLQHIT